MWIHLTWVRTPKVLIIFNFGNFFYISLAFFLKMPKFAKSISYKNTILRTLSSMLLINSIWMWELSKRKSEVPRFSYIPITDMYLFNTNVWQEPKTWKNITKTTRTKRNIKSTNYHHLFRWIAFLIDKEKAETLERK